MSGVKALSGAVVWLVALAVLVDDGVVALGGTMAVVSLCGLLGGGGWPVVVYRFGAGAGRGLWRWSTGATFGGAVLAAVGVWATGGMSGGGLVVLVAVCAVPVACCEPVVDAWSVLGGRSRWVAARILVVTVLRVGLISVAAASGGVWVAVLAGVVPDAVAVLVVWRAVRPGPISDPVSVDRRFVGAQYVSVVLAFGAVMGVPVLVASGADSTVAAVVVPAWAGVAMVFSTVHSASNAGLVERSGGVWPKVAAGGFVVGGTVLWAMAGLVDSRARVVEIVGVAGVLLVATAPWPLVAGRVAGARVVGRAGPPIVVGVVLAVGAVVAGSSATVVGVWSGWAGAMVLAWLAVVVVGRRRV